MPSVIIRPSGTLDSITGFDVDASTFGIRQANVPGSRVVRVLHEKTCSIAASRCNDCAFVCHIVYHIASPLFVCNLMEPSCP